MLISSISASEIVLWDLLVTTNIENSPIFANENPIVSGKVVDHAGKAIQNAEVQIRIGTETVIIATSETGEFQHEFTGLQLIPGIYVVNVVATTTEKIGLTSIEFRVKGDLQVFSHTAELLKTPEAAKYLNSDPASFKYDPIGLTLYNYYQGLQEQYLLEQSLQKEILEQEMILDELRQISDDISQEIID
ncbi:MAG: carboxypeptidase-like regulatory domain-containing protein, partial [Nitrosopumilaceae archaeon]